MSIFFICLQVFLFIFAIVKMPYLSATISVPIKLTLSASFLVTAIYIYFSGNRHSFKAYIAFAMLMCFTGDCALSNALPISKLNNSYFGAFAFCIAHILFITAYIKLLKQNSVNIFNIYFFIGIILYLIVILILWWFLIYSANRSAITFVTLGYLILLGTMAAFALSLVKINNIYAITALGGVFFIISDLIIFTTYFGMVSFKYRDLGIWITYISALAGIIYTGILIP